MPTCILGVDTGGTFTDFVLLRDSRLYVHKVLSTPDAPERAILQGIHELGLENNELLLIHGSTVATNAVLEGKGVRTVYITNRGLRDTLTIGRQARRELYNLNPSLKAPPVPRELCLETGGRLSATGEELEPLTEAGLAELRAEVERLAPQAVAINLLFSWLQAGDKDSAECRIEAAMPEGLFVSRSSKVLPEVREYERGIATWLNAAVGPLVAGYLQRLRDGAPQAHISVMQSSGGTISAARAGEQAVHMLLSGPAGGLAGARYIGKQAGCERLLTFDMGGTSTDVALLDGGELRLTSEGRIGDYPVGVPMVDMHTIGAGGGSIARVDAGGMLQVGPESAGATPGPACYGQGGTEPTVTDANLLLGRLHADAFLGGNMSLDVNAARHAVGRVAEPLGLSIEAAAEGIITVANEHMARALRMMSVARGVDPCELTLACFGGAGGLHVCALAEALGMENALVPVHAGVLSALGMLVAPRARHLSRTQTGLLDNTRETELDNAFNKLAAEGHTALRNEGVNEKDIKTHLSIDLRYRGQSYAINLPWQGIDTTREAFQQRHEALYGHRLQQDVEQVTLRIKVQGTSLQIPLDDKATLEGVIDTAHIHRSETGVTVIPRISLQPEQDLRGPALITETVSTTWLAPGWRCRADNTGNLLLSRE
ncbi:N-methylhydantoinase A [hydrothermal vent metagenome]|uniref:N-methylhydantoinase A n=1 Tax=hydrothermal vent metagenome TaxID=652676 RepID=A0A3B1A8K3_9ZZZZ